jgi:hypothetical protein
VYHFFKVALDYNAAFLLSTYHLAYLDFYT